MTLARRRLGATDLELSPIGLGCGRLEPGAAAQRVANAVVDAALRGGVTWFDAPGMDGRGAPERALAAALRRLRVSTGQVTIADAWARPMRSARAIGAGLDELRAALDPYPVDLFQFGAPFGPPTIRAAMRVAARMVREGRIRAIGVSNFSAREMERAHAHLASEGVALASNQVPCSLLDRRIETDGVLLAARRLGVSLLAHTPLAGGILTGKFHDNPDLVRRLDARRRGRAGFGGRSLARSRPLVAELAVIALSYGVSPAQVALNWLVQWYGNAVLAVPGASRPGQASRNAETMGFALKRRELARLDELSRKVRG